VTNSIKIIRHNEHEERVLMQLRPQPTAENCNISLEITDRIEILTANLGFFVTRLARRKCVQVIALMTDKRKWHYGSDNQINSLSRPLDDTCFGALHKPHHCRQNFSAICRSSGDKYFLFWWPYCNFPLWVVVKVIWEHRL